MDEQFDDEMFEVDEFDETPTNQSSLDSPPINQEPPTEPPVNQPSEEEDLTTEVLKLKGINDPNKIKFEDSTSGAVVERAWDSLTREELINILGGVSELEHQPVENELSEQEIELLNNIRNSGMSVSLYIQTLTPIQLLELSSLIDLMSDDDLYAFDILNKVGSDNITDEELDKAVEDAKSNEELFNKTVKGLRLMYTQLEQDRLTAEANLRQQMELQKYDAFANSIGNTIANFNSLGGQEISLSNEEKDNLYQFITSLDENGTSALGKALQNPQRLTQAAFWLLNGDSVMEEMQKLTQDAYLRGYNAGKLDKLSIKLTFKTKLVKTTPQPKKDTYFDEWA